MAAANDNRFYSGLVGNVGKVLNLLNFKGFGGNGHQMMFAQRA